MQSKSHFKQRITIFCTFLYLFFSWVVKCIFFYISENRGAVRLWTGQVQEVRNWWKSDLKSDAKKIRHFQELGISKKSTIFIVTSPNFVKLFTSFGNNLDKVSWKLDKHCKFFTNDQVLDVSDFFCIRLYMYIMIFSK